MHNAPNSLTVPPFTVLLSKRSPTMDNELAPCCLSELLDFRTSFGQRATEQLISVCPSGFNSGSARVENGQHFPMGIYLRSAPRLLLQLHLTEIDGACARLVQYRSRFSARRARSSRYGAHCISRRLCSMLRLLCTAGAFDNTLCGAQYSTVVKATKFFPNADWGIKDSGVEICQQSMWIRSCSLRDLLEPRLGNTIMYQRP